MKKLLLLLVLVSWLGCGSETEGETASEEAVEMPAEQTQASSSADALFAKPICDWMSPEQFQAVIGTSETVTEETLTTPYKGCQWNWGDRNIQVLLEESLSAESARKQYAENVASNEEGSKLAPEAETSMPGEARAFWHFNQCLLYTHPVPERQIIVKVQCPIGVGLSAEEKAARKLQGEQVIAAILENN